MDIAIDDFTHQRIFMVSNYIGQNIYLVLEVDYAIDDFTH